MRGDFQKMNSSVAVKSVDILNGCYKLRITEDQIKSGLLNVHWPGRMDFLSKNVLLDAAHNLDGVKALKNEIKKLHYKKLILLTGIMKDKDYASMLVEISPITDRIIMTKPDTSRAAEPSELAKYAGGKAEIVENVGEAFEKAKTLAGRDDLLLVTGSIYLLGDVMKHEQSKK